MDGVDVHAAVRTDWPVKTPRPTDFVNDSDIAARAEEISRYTSGRAADRLSEWLRPAGVRMVICPSAFSPRGTCRSDMSSTAGTDASPAPAGRSG
jgi:hypothetical protein